MTDRPLCPRCGYVYTDRVKRTPIDRLISFFSERRPWRCESCGNKFWLDPASTKSKAPEPDRKRSAKL